MQSAFLNNADRLLRSKNLNERRSVLLGVHATDEYPILLDRRLLNEHALITGATGSGKTSLGLIPLMTQLIRGDDGTVIVLDLKGDDAMFQTARLEAERAGREFKWFTNRTGYSTHIFNPFAQSCLNSLTVTEVTGYFVAMLNLFHGSDYGRAYFSIMARSLLQTALQQSMGLGEATSRRRAPPRPIKTFADLFEYIRRITRDSDEYRAAEHLAFVIKNLADFPQLNLGNIDDADSTKPKRSTAIEHAIQMPEAIENKQVLYFYLSAAYDLYSLAEMARMVIYATIQAAVEHKRNRGKTPQVYLICDEAQLVVAQNISNVLAQARSFGIGCVFALQSLSQLSPPGGADLRDLVLNCTAIKQFWATRDPKDQDYISKISGEVAYYTSSWDQSRQRVIRGEIGREFARPRQLEGLPQIGIQEEIGPRLTTQAIDNWGRAPNVSITAIQRNSGYSCYDGAFPVHTDWIMTEEEYCRRQNEIAWPAKNEATICVSPQWDVARMDTSYTHKAQEVDSTAGLQQSEMLNSLGGDF